MTAHKKPWTQKRLTREEQIQLLGIHWRGHKNYQPKPAHLYRGSFILDRHKARRFQAKGYI